MFKLTSDAYISNFYGDNGEVSAIFKASCIDGNGNEGTAYWYDPDFSKADGADYSDCCDWDNPDEIVWD